MAKKMTNKGFFVFCLVAVITGTLALVSMGIIIFLLHGATVLTYITFFVVMLVLVLWVPKLIKAYHNRNLPDNK